MAKKLTLKQKEFTKQAVETKNGTEAVARVYNVKSRENASRIAYNLLRKPHIIREIEMLMEDRKVTGDLLVKKLKDGLFANKVTDYKGEVEQSNVPDLKVRHQYLDTALKLKNLYPAQQIESRSFNLDAKVEAMSREEVAQLLKELLAEYVDNSKKLRIGFKAGEAGDSSEAG